MRSALLLLVWPFFLRMQDPPPVTLEQSGPLRDVVHALEASSGSQIHLMSGVDDKLVTLSVREASLLQAVDALCRAHGNLCTYSSLRTSVWNWYPPQLRIHPGPFMDFPGTYSGPFKVIVPEITRHRLRSGRGEQAWTRVKLVLIAPPGIPVDSMSGSEAHYSIEEARDSQGRPIAIRENMAEHSRAHQGGYHSDDNVVERSVEFDEFDPDRGLSVLKGKFEITYADSEEVRIPLESGKPVAIPGGDVLVEELKQVEPERWRILLNVRPHEKKKRLSKLLEERCQVEPSPGTWQYLGSVEPSRIALDLLSCPQKPQWLHLFVRQGEHKRDVPFDLRDVRFKPE